MDHSRLARSAKRFQNRSYQIRTELDGLSIKELQARAKAGSASAEQLEDVADNDDPKAALIALLLKLNSVSSPDGFVNRLSADVEPEPELA